MHQEARDLLFTGQVIAVYKDRYLIAYDQQRIMAEVSGRFLYLHTLKSEYPQIGDYVKWRLANVDLGIIEQVTERKSILARQDVGESKEKHILAVNIDVVFICMSLNEDFSITKLRNFLSLTYGAHFETMILLTKKDLCINVTSYIEHIKHVTDDKIMTMSIYDNDDMMSLKTEIKDKTVVLIGSSGVGKSSVINALMGIDHFKTKDIRIKDAQGRHTTVNRELIELDHGAKIIDTPGIRIVSSYQVSEENFEDIINLSKGCRFQDCKHDKEPGCMIRKALDSGEIDASRWLQYQKAIRLNAYNKQRETERERMREKQASKRYE